LNLDRRTLLVGGGVGVGLVVAFALWPRRLASDLIVRRGEQAFGNFIKVARNGRVTVAVPQIETGQGVWTALPQIVADELGADWDSVGVEPAPLGGPYGNSLMPKDMRMTAESTSVRAFEQPLREAAAVARAMLVAAAAGRWNVAERECETADGYVISGARTLSFGELAEEAAERPPPSRPALRQSARSRLIGQPLARLDGPAKADGSMRFAGDVRLPGMLFASARLAPPGGRLTDFERGPISRFPGIRLIAMHMNRFAIVAENSWVAEQAVKAADPKFTGNRSPAGQRALFQDALDSGSTDRSFDRGDYDKIVRGSRPLAATYWVEPSLHLGLEPLTATARVSGDQVEVWAPNQAPDLAARSAGAILYPMAVGEPAGRAMESDLVALAIRLARNLRVPVQVTLPQSASQNHDRGSPGALARMTALPGQGGITAAWQMRVATGDGLGSAIARLTGGEPGKLGEAVLDGAAPPYAIPDVRVEAVAVPAAANAGYMRGSPQREYCFFTESFVDELAHAAGLEPLAFRMSMLGGNPRLARCLQAAAQLAQWDGGGRGSSMGIAACSAYGSHIALVATATIGDVQRIKVHRLAAAVDCGRIVNSGLVTQQVAGGLMWAMAQATVPAPAWVAEMPRARPFGALGLPRIGDTPDISIQLLKGSQPPGGISGLGTTVLAPAVANAIYAATGRRLRELPFDLMAAA
jgi:isoquinoline 1-oxidoreductase beta subunit